MGSGKGERLKGKGFTESILFISKLQFSMWTRFKLIFSLLEEELSIARVHAHINHDLRVYFIYIATHSFEIKEVPFWLKRFLK